MSFKFTLVLLALAVVAIAGFGLAQRQSPPPSGGPEATPTAVLLNFPASSLTSLDLKAGDRDTNLVKDGANWKLVKPSEDPNVDQAKVNSLLGQMTYLASTRLVAKPGEDIGPYGLRNPQLTVTLSGGGQTQTLLVGDKNVNGNQYYAMRQEGSDVGLIPSSLVTALMDLANNPATLRPSQTSAAPSA